MITNGALHAFDLLLRLLTGPGDRVITELPSYPGAFDAIRANSARVVPVPMAGDGGWDVAPARRRPAPELGPAGLPDPRLPQPDRLPGRRGRAARGVPRRPPDRDDGDRRRVLRRGRLHRAGAGQRRDRFVGDHDRLAVQTGLGRSAGRLDPRVGRSRAATGDPAGDDRSGRFGARPTRRHRAVPADGRDRRASPAAAAPPSRRAARRPRRASCRAGATTAPAGGLSVWVELDAPLATPLTLLAAQAGVHIVPGSRFGVDGTMERFIRLPFALPVDASKKPSAGWRVWSAARPIAAGRAATRRRLTHSAGGLRRRRRRSAPARPPRPATAGVTRASNGVGTMRSGASSLPTTSPSACAAASFMFSVILVAPGVERTGKDARKGQHVVDLIRVVAASARDDHGVPAGDVHRHLGIRVGEREDDRLVGHPRHRVLRDGARADSEEHVGAVQGVLERTAQRGPVRDRRQLVLHRPEVAAAGLDDARGNPRRRCRRCRPRAGSWCRPPRPHRLPRRRPAGRRVRAR